MNATLQKIYQAILEGDQPILTEAIQSALLASFNPEQLFAEAMLPAMKEVGRLFEAGVRPRTSTSRKRRTRSTC